MQKPANRILSALLVLVMVLSMLPATVFATGETDALEGWSITLGDNIGVNFYLSSADYTVSTTVNGAAVTPAISGKVATVNVAAAQMNDTIALTVKDGEEIVHTGEYSIRQYADTILSGSYDEEVKDLVKKMLCYGAAAQTYFNYNADALANSGITVGAATVPTEVPEITIEDNLAGIGLYGMSLLFRDKIAVRFYFTVGGNIADYTFKVGQTAYEPMEKDGKYYVEIGDINPQDMDKDITVSVNDGAMTVTYSPMNYIVRKYNSADSTEGLKALVQSMYGYHLEAVEYQKYLKIVKLGAMQAHPDSNNNWTSSGVYMAAAENDAPFNTDWTLEYAPTSNSAIKRIRDGETIDVAIAGRGTLAKYSETNFYMNINSWTMGDNAPAQDGDIYILEGDFYNEANDATIRISKTYIYLNGADAEFSTEMPTLPTTIDAGVMSKHSTNGWASNGVYATMAENAAPYDGWSVEYTPVAAENLKLIRNGETYNIGIPGRGTLVKYNATDYFLKMEWNVGDYAPMQDGDVLIVEGGFVNQASKVTLNIEKTYIYANGANVEFSTEMPTLATTVNGGMFSSNSNGWTSDGISVDMAANDAPYNSDWSLRYVPVSSDVIKLLRDGVTTNIANKDAETLVKHSETTYNIVTWMFGSYGLKAGDILIVEGSFVNNTYNVTLNVTKSYIQLNADGTVTVTATEPVPAIEVEGGNMTEHADGWDATGTVFFALSENAVPVDENAELAYTAADGVITLVRGGQNYAIAGSVVKYGAADYFLMLDESSSYLPLADQDYLIVEGAFSNASNGYTLMIAKTYILVDGDNVVFSTTEPVFETEFAVTGLTNHGNGWTADGIYITHDAHQATYNTDWSVEYKPVSADAIKLVRGGVTTIIGQPASGTLVVYGATNMYLKTAAWTIQGGVLPFVDGDQIIIEGKFKHEASGDVLAVEKTVIYIDGTSLIFNPIEAGNLGNHSNGMNSNGEGIYATMAPNAALYDGWNIEYTPVTADAYYVIRNGEQINIGIPGRGTLVKYNDTDYYLKINSWCTNNFAYTTDDIIVIDGFWKNDAQGVTMKMEKTYLYYDGSAWVFATELPSVINAGLMQTHPNGMSGTGIYFKLDANDAPYDGWNIEYKQTSVDNIKLIRDGETISIGIADRPLFVKYGETDYFLKLEKWTIGEYGVNGGTTPITTDDVIIIEGNFVYDNVTMKVTKSYVYYDGTAWVCSAEAPAQKNIVDVVELGSHSNGWTSGGFYFTAAANDAPLNTDWSLRYKPVSADAIKVLNADGTTTNVGNTGAETVVKFSETGYYIEGWAVGSANMKAGTVLVIDGQFYNAANDVYIDVENTTITFNEGGTTTIISESSKYIHAGIMSAYAAGPNWFGDGIYFVLGSNAAPADAAWNVRYKPTAAANIKLIRNGQTYEIANTGAETIVKIADGQYWLSLESWWWSSYAPIVDGDVLVVEGVFTNESNGYTLDIEKTYITFVSKDNDDVAFSAGADTEFGEVLLPNSNGTLTIGVWNGSHHIFNDERMAELQAAGITKIMGIKPEYTGAEFGGITGMLDRAQNHGIQVIVDLRDWDGVTVPEYVDHPALLGFLMFDEPCATDFDTLADLKDKFDAVMPEDMLFYVNLFPSCAAGTALMGSVNWALGQRDYDKYYVTAFLTKLDIEVLSWDNYSLLEGSGIRTDYFYNFEVMASKNVPMWYTMLSSGHDTTYTSYATPTAEELRWQMAVALTYGVQNIDHYIYTSHEDDYTTMLDYDTETVTDLYYDIKDVNNEFLAWDNIFMAYDWIGVAMHSANSNNAMLTKLKKALVLSDYGVSVTGSDENLLIGVFDYNGDKAYMVTNAGSAGNTTVGDGKNFTMDDAAVTLTLADADYKCVAIIDNGEISYVAVENNTVTLNVEAYEGVFVIPVLN